MKMVIAAAVSLCLFIVIGGAGCEVNPCGPGQQECPDGTCTDSSRVCCGGGESCPGGTTCGPDNTCLGTSTSSCLNDGEETCYNTDGTQDCAPLGAACCGNHKFCPAGTVCVNGGTSCAQ